MASIQERFARSPYRIVGFPIAFAVALIVQGVIFDNLLSWDTAGGISVALSVFFILLAAMTLVLLVYLQKMDFRE